MRACLRGFLPVLLLCGASGVASGQERTFDCDENGVTGRSLSIRVTGPDTITAGPLRGTTMSMVQSGSNRFSFSGGPYRLTISEDQSRVIVRAPGSERIDCVFSAGTRQLKATDDHSSCPPGTRPKPETDDCIPIKGKAPPPSDGGVGNFVGTWVQTSSNAGACPTCSITIAKRGAELRVSSSNGWQATVYSGQDGDTRSATGSGRWPANAGGAYAGRQFSLDLTAGPRGLTMSMVHDGTRQAIRAQFVRR